MGNSGSVHNLAALDDHQHHFSQYHTAINRHHSPAIRQSPSGLPLPPNQWSQSIPRTQRPSPGLTAAPIKVLPTLTAGSNGLRLRATNNGDILHGGGTISGRRESTVQKGLTTPPQPNRLPPPMQRAQTQINMVGRKPTPLQAFQKLQHSQAAAAAEVNLPTFKRFDSEPDLRGGEVENNKPIDRRPPMSSTPSNRSMAAVRKKLAPPPPVSKIASSPSRPTYDPSRFGWKPSRPSVIEKPTLEPTTFTPRKLRLFKTKAESRAKSSTKPTEQPFPTQTTQFRREKSFDMSLLLLNQRHKDATSALPMPASAKSDDFQRELLAATATRRQSVVSNSTVPVDTALPIPRVRHLPVVPSTTTPTPPTPPPPPPPPLPPLTTTTLRHPSHHPATPTNQSLLTTATNQQQSMNEPENSAVSKTFYFGMEETIEEVHLIDEYLTNKIQMDVIDRFAESLLHKHNRRQRRRHNRRHGRGALSRSPSTRSSSSTASSSVSSVSSMEDVNDEGDLDDTMVANIHVQMRPTLPRRQLEIPRFSPAAAWRTLASASAELLMEDQPHQIANQFSSYVADEDEEEEEEQRQEETIPLESRIERIYREPLMGAEDGAAFADTTKSGDSGISGDAGDDGQPQVMATAAVGPFPAAWTPQLDLGEDEEDDGEEEEEEEDIKEQEKRSPLNFASKGGHIFSLSLPRDPHIATKLATTEFGAFNSLQKLRSNNDEEPTKPDTNWLLGRSAPNSLDIFDDPMSSIPTASSATITLTSSRRPRQQQPSFGYLGGSGAQHVMYLPNQTSIESPRKYSTDLVDTPPEDSKKRNRSSQHHHHRFTFQSTVRQIERRRLAERLSRNAEQMEAQRVTEAEAMRRVEEEFQRKRANEKANIRQQLRLYTQLQNGSGSGELAGHRSIPFDWQQSAPRADPDGAVSSPRGSPHSPYKLSRRNETSKDMKYNNQGTLSTGSSRSSSEDRKMNRTDIVDDDRCSSSESYGPQDTKTPYIMRLIEAKSVGNRSRQPPSTEILSEFRSSHARREYVDYRGTSTNHHPRAVVGRIPNSSPGAGKRLAQGTENHMHHNNRHDHHNNYRREFAHGRSICSSDSEISASGGKTIERRYANRTALAPSSDGSGVGIMAKALPARAR